MTRPFEPEDGHSGPGTAADGRATAGASASSTSCPRCRALEDRIAALEAEVAALRAAAGVPPGAGPPPGTSAPATAPTGAIELPRTPPGWGLYLKGPSNRWKTNCHPLEGVIETWWLNYTFTINWKLAEPGTVSFARGESIGQLVPVPHATFREATAIEAPIGRLEPQAARELLRWMDRRQKLVGQKVNVHHLYRRAAGVEDHLRKVGVPAIESHLP